MIRQYQPAEKWLSEQATIQFAVSAIVWLEVLDGVQNKRDQRLALKVLRRFERIELAPPDLDWAIRQSILYWLSHRVDSMDCLIASASFRLHLPLYYRNLKHFAPLLGNLVKMPY